MGEIDNQIFINSKYYYSYYIIETKTKERGSGEKQDNKSRLKTRLSWMIEGLNLRVKVLIRYHYLDIKNLKKFENFPYQISDVAEIETIFLDPEEVVPRYCLIKIFIPIGSKKSNNFNIFIEDEQKIILALKEKK